MKNSADAKTRAQQRFGQYAYNYVRSQTHARGADLDRLLMLTQPQKSWRTLDIATGGGHTAIKFAPHVRHVIASDITIKMLRAAQAHVLSKRIPNVSFIPADAEYLPFASGSFHLVTCRIAAHHFPHPRAFIRECARVLKTSGLLAMQDHVLPENPGDARYIDHLERLRDPSHGRAYSEQEWVEMFTHANIAVVHTEQISKRHVFSSWARRQGCNPETIAQLEALIAQAPAGVKAWLDPQDFGAPSASFANRHILILGRKPLEHP